jgi:hypothetical protein
MDADLQDPPDLVGTMISECGRVAVVDALWRLAEQQRFMKGLFAWVGFGTKVVDSAASRSRQKASCQAGNYGISLNWIMSFSTAPLRVI